MNERMSRWVARPRLLPLRPHLGLRVGAEEPLQRAQGIDDTAVAVLAVGEQAVHVGGRQELLGHLVGGAHRQAGVGQQTARPEVVGELDRAGRVRVCQLALRHHEAVPQRAQLDDDEGGAAGLTVPAGGGTTMAAVTCCPLLPSLSSLKLILKN